MNPDLEVASLSPAELRDRLCRERRWCLSRLSMGLQGWMVAVAASLMVPQSGSPQEGYRSIAVRTLAHSVQIGHLDCLAQVG